MVIVDREKCDDSVEGISGGVSPSNRDPGYGYDCCKIKGTWGEGLGGGNAEPKPNLRRFYFLLMKEGGVNAIETNC